MNNETFPNKGYPVGPSSSQELLYNLLLFHRILTNQIMSSAEIAAGIYNCFIPYILQVNWILYLRNVEDKIGDAHL